MTPSDLAHLSNLALYGAMACLTLAMLAFAGYVGRAAARRQAAAPAAPAREQALVHAGGGGQRAGAPARPGVPADAAPDPGAARVAGGRAGNIGMSLTWLSTMLLLASVALRGLAVSRPPVGNLFEFAVGAAAMTLTVYLLTALKWPLRWLGLFVVTPTLLLLGVALTVWYTAATELGPALQDYWLGIHVPIAILSVGVFTVAVVVLLLQLLKERREARASADEPGARVSRVGGFLDELPSSARLDRLAYSLHVIAFPLWTFTLIAGAIWGQKAWGTYWSWDPKETWTFVIWVIYAAYLHARATSGWSRRTANIIAISGYVAIVLNLTVVNTFFPGLHSYSGL